MSGMQRGTDTGKKKFTISDTTTKAGGGADCSCTTASAGGVQDIRQQEVSLWMI